MWFVQRLAILGKEAGILSISPSSEQIKERRIKEKRRTSNINRLILLHQKFLQFDWLRAVVFQLNLKYLHVKITNPLWVVV